MANNKPPVAGFRPAEIKESDDRSPAGGVTRSPFMVGLIGGIGSGKSKVAAAFAARGARVIAGDDLAHEALRQPAIKAKIAERWGRSVFDERGEIDRGRLATVVFAAPDERRALEMLVHPWIQERIRHEMEEAGRNPKIRLIVLDAAIMLEAGWNDICDRLVFVDAPREERLRRVTSQRGWNAQQLEARERAQLPLTEKALRADHALDNSGSLDHLGSQVDELLRQWGLRPESSSSCPGALG